MDNINNIENPGYFKFTLGSLELLVVTDGESVVSPIQPMFAPDVDPALVTEFLQNNFLSTDQITLAGNVLVVKYDERIILIDTGCGPLLSPQAGKLLSNLAKAGIQADDVSDIVLTHAHPDHIGGIVHENGALTFPYAEIYISQVEHDFWMGANPDFSKGTQNAVADFEIMFARQALSAIQSKLHFFKDGDTILNCLKLSLAPGHTPGHTIISVYSDGQELIHVADAFQHILLLEYPEWGNQIDSDFDLAIQTRKNISQTLAGTRQLVFADHLPYPGLGFINVSGAGFSWIPKAYYTT